MRLITRLSKTRVRERMERRVEAAAYHQQEVHARDLEMPMYDFREVDDAKDAHYAILSHRWNSIDEEITFDDIRLSRPLHSKPKGRQKLEFLLDQANKDGLTYVWIDTCCIDKSSSAELPRPPIVCTIGTRLPENAMPFSGTYLLNAHGLETAWKDPGWSPSREANGSAVVGEFVLTSHEIRA